jgi:hypothetical protein
MRISTGRASGAATGDVDRPAFPRNEEAALARVPANPTAAPDESEKLDGLLLGQQSSHQRAAQLTAGLGVEQQSRHLDRAELTLPLRNEPECVDARAAATR